MRSSWRNAEWPSLRWKTVGSSPSRAQHADAADAEHDLLAQPIRPAAAVERVGDRPVRVAADPGVDQIERRAADPHPPDAEPDRHELPAVVRELDHGGHRHELERQAARVRRRVVLELAVVLVEPLLEVAAAVEEPDPDEREVELRRRLEVVAGEHAEAPGIDREALVEPELRGEVGDEEVCRAALVPPPRLLAAVAYKALLHPRQPLEVVRRERSPEVVVRQLGQERGRVVGQLGETPGIERGEEGARLGDPREGEVARDLEERHAQRRAVVYLGHDAAP